jgi:hypothetical protein
MSSRHYESANPANSHSQGPHIPSEKLVELAIGLVIGEARDKANEHLVTCSRCSLKMRALYAALEAKFGPPSQGTSTPKEEG